MKHRKSHKSTAITAKLDRKAKKTSAPATDKKSKAVRFLLRETEVSQEFDAEVHSAVRKALDASEEVDASVREKSRVPHATKASDAARTSNVRVAATEKLKPRAKVARSISETTVSEVAEEEGAKDQIQKDVDAPEAEAAEAPSDPYFFEDSAICRSALLERRWTNKQRTLVFCSRGISSRSRHLMEDFRRMLPHAKVEAKWDKNSPLPDINEVCALKSCNNCLFFDSRRAGDLYLWLVRSPHGPSMRFQVLNVHTLGELKMSGNCLMHSRPMLTFDKNFDDRIELKLFKELFSQAVGVPRNHPKSKPFVDHVISAHYLDHKIWLRHYQISPMTEKDADKPERQVLIEIGPRLVLDPIRVLDGSFSGRTIYLNPHYLSPTALRVQASKSFGNKYADRVAHKKERQKATAARVLEVNPAKSPFHVVEARHH